MQVTNKIVKVEDITQEQKNGMFEVMDRHFINSDRDTFEEDLADKNWVLLLLEQDSDKIVGFSTQKLFRAEHDNKSSLVVYSGDTIVDKAYWGSMALHKAFGQLMLDIIDKNQGETLYWMLISKGLRTYKFLPVFFIEYYPSFEKPTPPQIQSLMHYLGSLKFPTRYNPKTGIIEAPENSQFLDQQFEPHTAVKKPYEKFYYEKNPGHYKGDELMCLTRFSLDNLTPFIKRVLTRNK